MSERPSEPRPPSPSAEDLEIGETFSGQAGRDSSVWLNGNRRAFRWKRMRNREQT